MILVKQISIFQKHEMAAFGILVITFDLLIQMRSNLSQNPPRTFIYKSGMEKFQND
jgi:hypothetical protein